MHLAFGITGGLICIQWVVDIYVVDSYRSVIFTLDVLTSCCGERIHLSQSHGWLLLYGSVV